MEMPYWIWDKKVILNDTSVYQWMNWMKYPRMSSALATEIVLHMGGGSRNDHL